MRNFRDYVPPPKVPKRTPAEYARIGKTIIALGAIFFVGSFAYMRHGSTMSSMQALVASLPMFLIFVGFGGAIWKQGMAGVGPMISYLSAVVAACGAAAAWLWGT